MEDAGDGLAAALAGNSLMQAYIEQCRAQNRAANHLIKRSLDEAAEANIGELAIDAPGNHPQVFNGRLNDIDMAIFSHVNVFQSVAQYIVAINLSYNELTDVGVDHLVQGLIGGRSERLQSLSLSGNSIGPRGCDILCEALRQCPALQFLELSRNPLGRPGGLILIGLLQECPELLHLYMADTEADIDVLVAIAAVLLTGVPKLAVCDVENPRIATLQEEHTVHLGRMLRVNTHLTEMRLGKHKMRDEGVRQLVSFLVENKTLRVLDLRCNEIGAAGAAHLGVLLATDCQLLSLNLSGNRIGERSNVEGATALGAALQNNRMLSFLDLNHNSLCGEALYILAEAIDNNSTLETIALFHNQWNQPASLKFHRIFNDRARVVPLRADFVTSQVDLRIDICQKQDFE